MRSERIYRWLLHLFPAAFREDYQAEMVGDFAALRRAHGLWAAWARVLADLAVAAPAAQMSALGRDLRHGVRRLAAAPALPVLMVLTLGLGVGANTAIYSLTDALLFRPLPVPRPGRLVTIGRGEGTSEPASYPDFVDLRDRNRTFAGLAAFEPISVALGDTERVMCEIVSGNYFPVLGLEAALGRLLGPEDDLRVGAHPVAVLSDGLWTRKFHRDPQVLGKEVRVNGHRFSIVGVAPKEFRGSAIPLTVELWVPLAMYREAFPALRDRNANRGARWLALIGRLKDGVSTNESAADVNAIERQIQEQNPELIRGGQWRRQERRLFLAPARGVLVQRRMMGLAATLMMIVTGLVLAIACVNVANLLLAHGTARQRELGIRLALGASRRRIVRQLLTENALLSLLGAGAGFAFAWLALRLLGDLRTPAPGPWQWSAHAAMDWRALAYAVLVALGSATLFGLWPALRITGLAAQSIRRQSNAARGNRLRQALVAGQIALSVVLLVAAGLLVRTLRNLHGTSPQFETSRQLVVQIDFNSVDYSRARKQQFLDEAKRRIEALPAVEKATLTGGFVPFNLSPSVVAVRPEGVPAVQLRAGHALVEPEFFSLLGIPLLAGRPFASGEPKAVVNRTLAARLWPNENPIGKRVRIGDALTLEVAGVARDAKYYALNEAPLPFVYLPFGNEQVRAQFDERERIFIKTMARPALVAGSVRDVFSQLDPAVEIRDVKPLQSLVDFALWPTRLALQFLAGFSLLGLVLGAAGLYGVMSYTVERWTHEMGIRQALGASPAAVVKLVLRRGMRLAAFGLSLGLVLAVGAARFLRAMLSGVSPVDPVTYAGVAALLAAVAILACLGPARRAARTDPVAALRQE